MSDCIWWGNRSFFLIGSWRPKSLWSGRFLDRDLHQQRTSPNLYLTRQLLEHQNILEYFSQLCAKLTNRWEYIIMELDLLESEEASKSYLNGAVSGKRTNMELSTKEAAQVRRQKEAEKEYGRGKKVPGRFYKPNSR